MKVHNLLLIMCALMLLSAPTWADILSPKTKRGAKLKLPAPQLTSDVSLEAALASRRSVRAFTAEQLTLAEIAQICWAAQGVTREKWGFRTAPSAGALYPLELYLLMPEGVFHYIPEEHVLQVMVLEDKRGELGDAALGQNAVYAGVCTFVITGVVARTEAKYGDRARRYVHIETGHAAQNILLQAAALGLGAVPIGAFNDERVAEVLELPRGFEPVYIIPTGHAR
ncbi:MAG: hypothetical protein B1H03_00550 [Planctomycetales bacterium 4484_113]|nr:MAG: hypothetical protein B1H03_00550 [Planctomycetales bacterium 4484_113]